MAKNDKYSVLIENIIDLMGGKSNISYFTHCATRLRFNVKDKGLVKADDIAKLPGAVGAQWSGDQYQVIVGQEVDGVYASICEKNGIDRQDAHVDDAEDAKTKINGPMDVVRAVIQAVTSCILPVVPAMVGTSFVKTVAVLLNIAGILPADSSTYLVMCFCGEAALAFMPVIVAYSAAKFFKTSAPIAMGLCSILVYSSFATAFSEGTATTIFGIPMAAGSYTNMLFPSILIVWVMSYIERFISKHCPKMIEYIATPFLTTLIMLPIALCALAPIGLIVGDGITAACMFIYERAGFLAVGLLTAIFPLLVLTGMHYATIPAMTTCFLTYGYDPLIFPSMALYNFCQGAAALGVAIKSKNPDVKGLASGVSVTAIIGGITEPTLFGLSLRYKTPLVASVIGGFIGGCIFGFFGCGMFTPGGNGIMQLVAFVAPDMNLFFLALASVAIAMVITVVGTILLYKDEPAAEAELEV